jgi:penicillin-binding protein 2
MLFRYLRDVRFKIDIDRLSDIQGPVATSETANEAEYDVMSLRYRILVDEWAYRNGTPLRIAEGLDEETIHLIEEQNFRFMGLLTGLEYRRAYAPEAVNLSHVMGYVGAIDSEEYESLKNLGYLPDRGGGKAGVNPQRNAISPDRTECGPTTSGQRQTKSTFVPETIGSEPVPAVM